MMVVYGCSSPSLEWCTQIEEDNVPRDNRAVTTIPSATGDMNQELSHKEIEELKANGTDGSQIIDALVTHSKTFDSMTDLAQKKYKKRKAEKYLLIGCAQKPTAATLAEAYYSKQASRVGYLRPDTLALVLCMANVGPHQNVLVLESSSGLVTGAVAERLGGYGEVCSAHYGRNASGIAISNFFNFDDRIKKTIHTKPLLDLLHEVRGLSKRAKYFKDKKFSDEEEDNDNDVLEDSLPERKEPRFTSCIITSTYYCVKSALVAVLPLLAPSATFAVASPLLEPLVDCMNLIRVKGYAYGTSIQEPWKRDIQVLPKRTHPAMNMTHGGGYILTGTVSKRGRWVDLNTYRSDMQESSSLGNM